ncbi:hypothetical protein GLA29479_4527 [Lysobacter antibioticus]|nr:hypothetical protein GLA29479_4527 [Lysobacter antibioticus]
MRIDAPQGHCIAVAARAAPTLKATAPPKFPPPRPPIG